MRVRRFVVGKDEYRFECPYCAKEITEDGWKFIGGGEECPFCKMEVEFYE